MEFKTWMNEVGESLKIGDDDFEFKPKATDDMSVFEINVNRRLVKQLTNIYQQIYKLQKELNRLNHYRFIGGK